jgi:hypothetical protein
MKKIISFSLWGNNPIYTQGAIRNAELAKEVYPDWICRYYVGKSTPNDITEKLKHFNNTEVIEMDNDGDWTGMFWRFYPAGENDVDVVIVRDCDSRLNNRERDAVNEWLNSDKGFHIMRDHPYHTTAILGGMWGSKKGVTPNIKQQMETYVKGNFWQVDQNFLRDIIYPIVKNNSLVHDEFFDKKQFPSKRPINIFVGQAFNDKDEFLHPEHLNFL